MQAAVLERAHLSLRLKPAFCFVLNCGTRARRTARQGVEGVVGTRIGRMVSNEGASTSRAASPSAGKWTVGDQDAVGEGQAALSRNPPATSAPAPWRTELGLLARLAGPTVVQTASQQVGPTTLCSEACVEQGAWCG
jgi:hypothetical protein